jgi:uncharacterized SAM-binding protein YcdF (DUF218 family)
LQLQSVKQFALAGLILKKERWGLSWIGWSLMLLALLAGFAVMLFCVFPFLAVTQRLNTNVLVVEGWIPDFAIRAAAVEFASRNYEHAFTTGGPVSGMGGYTNDYNTSASVGASRLKVAGVRDVQMVPSRVMDRDRTYAAAVALKDWFYSNNFHPRAINVVTEGPHARRTRLLFQKAFGDQTGVGIIAVCSPDYDRTKWWSFSEGVRDVVGEAFAYLYARVFFHPSKAKAYAPVGQKLHAFFCPRQPRLAQEG